MTSSTPAQVTIEKRPSGLKFERPDAAAGWVRHNLAAQVFLDTFSCYLPLGERFFVESVRYYEDRIRDEKLKQEVKKFIYQEVQHSLSHRNYNAALYRHNAAARASEQFARLLLWLARRLYSRRMQLSITVALEHFTAIISHWLLTVAVNFLKRNDNDVALLWVWHAIEETEHKAVAFDVFMAVTPNRVYAYVLRVLGMIIVSSALFPALLLNVPAIFFGDRFSVPRHQRRPAAGTVQPGGRQSVLRAPAGAGPSAAIRDDQPSLPPARITAANFFPKLLGRLYRPYFRYFRYSFHPWQEDNSQLLNKVKAQVNFDAIASGSYGTA